MPPRLKSAKTKKAVKTKKPQGPQNFIKVQKLMAEAVMRQLTPDWKMNKKWKNGGSTTKVAESIIKPNDRLTSFERLEIYNKQYWFRLHDCMADDFPGVHAVLGKRKFHHLVRAYISKCPSRSYTLRNLGQFLVGFLEKNPSLTAPHTALAIEVATFEWAQIVGFDGATKPVIAAADLQKANPQTLRLALQPYITLLRADHALDDFSLALRKQTAAGGQASQASGDKITEHHAKRIRPKKERVYLVIHRFDNSLYYKRLPAAGFALLEALQGGSTLVQAASRLTRRKDIGPMPDGNTIRDWFILWVNLGWFCKR